METAARMKPSLTLKLYRGDAKTLLAFNLPKSATKDLAGFTIQCQPAEQAPYYIFNELQFKNPSQHAQDPKEPPYSSINAPIHKFRWLHIPGLNHQGLQPALGAYTYTVTPRYLQNGSLQPLDPQLGVSARTQVVPFVKGKLSLGFTRGYTQSQAFVRHFGLHALIRPATAGLQFDTSQVSGASATGQKYTFNDEYEWLGFTARQTIFDVLNEVIKRKTLWLDVFAYDLNEPEVVDLFLQLAKEGRIRIILDNAALHTSKGKTKSGKAKRPAPEDEFEKLFREAAKKGAGIKRGKFGRYAHDKVFIVSDSSGARKVLTGSTNFSVTGMYVNSNHILVFDDPKVAAKYSDVFEQAWNTNVAAAPFRKSPLSASTPFVFSVPAKTEITFSPHTDEAVADVLGGVSKRITKEGRTRGGSVLFAVMQIDKGTSPVYTALNDLHKNTNVFSYGISDSPKGIYLYKPGNRTGVLVTGKPVRTQLPPPFNQVRNIGGVGHQIHHKFVVCGFNGNDPVVYCGSSNLAQGGEKMNGDNLLAIHDGSVATAFVLEALALVDHFNFLDRFASNAKQRGKTPPALKGQAAASVGWFLSTDDSWASSYFEASDLHCVERELFG